MTKTESTFSLDAVCTDGWFQRMGEAIGEFQSLCDIVGAHFVAFSIIVGARITSLMVDRRSPEHTLVDFVVGAGDAAQLESQRVTLGDFRRRLVGTLLMEDGESTPPPQGESDIEGLQAFVGVRYLLLAPLYGYSLRKLTLGGSDAVVDVVSAGRERSFKLEQFRGHLRECLREELEKISTPRHSAIDLSKIAQAEAAALALDWSQVVLLLGEWPSPLALYLRTPEGQKLSSETREMIAKALGLLGSACMHLGKGIQAQEIFRLGIQYAQEGSAAADLFFRLGEALLHENRPGEAIAPLRRALAFGGPGAQILPRLARAFRLRKSLVASYACLRAACEAGVHESEIAEDMRYVEGALGVALISWKAGVGS